MTTLQLNKLHEIMVRVPSDQREKVEKGVSDLMMSEEVEIMEKEHLLDDAKFGSELGWLAVLATVIAVAAIAV